MRAHTPGRFVWRAHHSADVAQAGAFYGALFGWSLLSLASEKRAACLAKAGDTLVCAFAVTSTPSTRPHWSTYLSVEDVDGAAAIAAISGGHVVAPPAEVEGQGRCALIADPQGATVHLLRATEGDAHLTPRPAPFTFAWETLHTIDRAAAVGFYGRLAPWHFGDVRGRTTVSAGTGTVADIQPALPGSANQWTPFVAVLDVAERCRAAVDLGATVRVQELHLPGVGRAAVVEDPFGAVLGLLGPASTP